VRRWLKPGPLGALGLLVLVALAVIWITPSDDYLFLPDTAQPLAPKVFVQGERPDRNGGGIYFVEVHIRKASILESHFPSIHEGATLVPANQVVPRGESEKQRFKEDLQDMRRSQQVAAAVALRQAGYDVKVVPTGVLITTIFAGTPAAQKLHAGDVVVAVDGTRVLRPDALGRRIRARKPGETVRLRVRRGKHPVNVVLRTIRDPGNARRPIVGIGIAQAAAIHLPIKVRIDLGRVGGPSAGLAFALDILDELGRNVDHGLKVAATGELALDGSIHPIGGVKQKTIGARHAHVDVFLVPAGENAAEARRNADGLRIVPVSNFRQALRALATIAKTG
jgi:PDZ domain-containing protein